MKNIIILFMIICTSSLQAQLKYNRLELFFAGGLSQNYGDPITPRDLPPVYFYYGTSEDQAISHQFGFLFFPKKTQVGRFSLGFGIQALRLKSVAKADSIIQVNNLFNPNSVYYETSYNVSWNVKQFLGQFPFLIRYSAVEKGSNRYFAEGGIVLSFFDGGYYPPGAGNVTEQNYYPGYILGVGYIRLINPGNAHGFVSTSLTWFRTQGRIASGQIPGFIGIRLTAGLEWNFNGK
jgi:hypothetical protein